MRFFMSSFSILLALVAFGPSQSIAREPGGGQGGGHSGGGQPSVQQHGPGNAAVLHNAGPNMGRATFVAPNLNRAAPGVLNVLPNAEVRVHPVFPIGVGIGAAVVAENWRYRSEGGRWWYWTPQNRWMWYGDNGQWSNYSDTANAYVVERPILQNPLPEENFSGGPITISNPTTNSVSLSYTLDGVAYTIAPGYNQDFREDRAWVIQFSRGTNLDQVQYGLQSGLYTFTRTNRGWELFRSELR